jgi:hypothetical protein
VSTTTQARRDGRTKASRDEITEVVTSDLRALLFWANVGVAKSTSGSYQSINDILESYADRLHFKLSYPTWFGSGIKKSEGGR